MTDVRIDPIPVAPATLGQLYRDTITGYQGAAVSRTEYLYGCVRVGLERADKDGKSEVDWFDEQRLVVVETAQPVATTATSGGPMPAPRRAPVPPSR